jgi:hypothetical protein
MATRYHAGDRVVFTRDKYSSSPSPRAKNIVACPNGESYQYQVDKFWVVVEVRPGGELLVVTRRGKTHVIQADNPQLRKASLLERLLKSRLFPQLASSLSAELGRPRQAGSLSH